MASNNCGFCNPQFGIAGLYDFHAKHFARRIRHDYKDDLLCGQRIVIYCRDQLLDDYPHPQGWIRTGAQTYIPPDRSRLFAVFLIDKTI